MYKVANDETTVQISSFAMWKNKGTRAGDIISISKLKITLLWNSAVWSVATLHSANYSVMYKSKFEVHHSRIT